MWWGTWPSLYETNSDQDKILSPPAGNGCRHLPRPVASGLSLSQRSQYFPLWVWIIRLKDLSSSPDCDVLEGGDHVLSYLKIWAYQGVPLKPHCYLFFFFLFVVICNFTVRMSFLRPLESYFLARHSSIVMAIFLQNIQMFNFLKSRGPLWFMWLTWWGTSES